MENPKTKKLLKALNSGTPIRIALPYAGIAYADYMYWLSVFATVEYMRQQDELSELRKSKSRLAEIKRKSYETFRVEDDDGKPMEADPEIVALYSNSKSFREEADGLHELVRQIREAKTKAIVKHLDRISDANSTKAAVSASQWFLERSLPTDFGKQEGEAPVPIAPIKVEFVKCDSPNSMKRIEDMERELLGDRKLA